MPNFLQSTLNKVHRSTHISSSGLTLIMITLGPIPETLQDIAKCKVFSHTNICILGRLCSWPHVMFPKAQIIKIFLMSSFYIKTISFFFPFAFDQDPCVLSYPKFLLAITLQSQQIQGKILRLGAGKAN
jgi:hypothetical protein